MKTATVKDRLLTLIAEIGVSVNMFERICGLSQGYVKNLRKGLSEEMWERISRAYPDVSKVWLLTGEGDMLLPRTSQTATGNGNVQVAGNGNRLGTDAMDELKAQLAKKDEQIERLLAIIDKLTNG